MPVAPMTSASISISISKTDSNAPGSRVRRSAGSGSDHMHQNLHFSATWIEERTESLLHNRIRFDTSCDDFLDREFAARNHGDRARPHRSLETPGRLDGDVLQRPQRGIHERLFYVQAGLHNSPVVAP